MIRAIIFDCFGVIITDALKVVIEELEAIDPGAARQVNDIIHANNRGLLEPAESNRQIAEILGISTEAFRTRIQQGEIKDERVLTYVLELRKQYKTALITNIGRQSLQRRLSSDELQAHFDVVIVSGDVGLMKPDPKIYIHAANELGVAPEECIFIDDRGTHCVGARVAGMHAVLFRDLAQVKREVAALLLANTKH